MGFFKSGIWGKALFRLSFIFLWVHAWDSPFLIGSILDWSPFAWQISLLTRRGHQLDFADGQSHWLRFLLWYHFKQECAPPRSDGCKSRPSYPFYQIPEAEPLQITPVVPEVRPECPSWELPCSAGGSEGVALVSHFPYRNSKPMGPSQIGTVSAWGSGDVVRCSLSSHPFNAVLLDLWSGRCFRLTSGLGFHNGVLSTDNC